MSPISGSCIIASLVYLQLPIRVQDQVNAFRLTEQRLDDVHSTFQLAILSVNFADLPLSFCVSGLEKPDSLF